MSARGVTAAAFLALICGSVLSLDGADPNDAVGSPEPASAVTAPERVVITPAAGTLDVQPVGAVEVSAVSGRLGRVSLVNEAGRSVPGEMSPDGSTWRPAVPLGYGRTYTLEAVSRGADGPPARKVSTFTTVAPQSQASVTLTSTSGANLREGATYGVGIVVVADFDRPIPDRAAAERALAVTTEPRVDGSWYWVDERTAHWRPQLYHAPGTSISVAANIYGLPLGDGVYGAADRAVTFRIGDAHIAIADDRTKQIQVFDNGELVRTMPTSMGKGGTQTIGGATLAFWTQRGVYTVLDKSESLVMDSSTYGLPVDSGGYRLTVDYAVRLSHNGIYLHQLDSTVWAQGNTNVSHGCLNLNADHARWFYDFAQPGDVVEVRNTGGDPLPLGLNGDWGVPWDEWLRGSALG
ncbi:L,D-transpeptidase [Mycolicibacterium pyrenivorans]|uniref:L,D-transpeptidase n=1 Tax=Mycolicibacterium pyrenivorans TaxID=187102 RepID=UPI0023AA61BB|nr:L,D-transpeptidase [Mycolicibacterium pyrenivorans]